MAAGLTPSARARETIETLARRYGFDGPRELGDQIGLSSRYTTLRFDRNSRRIWVNDILIYLNGETQKRNQDWTLTRVDAVRTLDPLLRAAANLAGSDITTVVLDPGHGGQDSGAIGHRRIHEKKAVLDIALRARHHLEAAGLLVRLTRDRDRFIPLKERPALARRWGADLFVSIHLNAVTDTKVSGIETYVLSSQGFTSTMNTRSDARAYPGNLHDARNMILAYYCHRALLRATGSKDRGIRRARFEVLRDAPCPAVLLECEYISNPAEAERFLEAAHRERVAKAIADGILAYVNRARE